ncbi:MAG: GGDEF domain-containing protein [Deltaproteobacteria bacterium]|nr:GGDEF domain-containing protein [Deltaproteobacteria bacterium]
MNVSDEMTRDEIEQLKRENEALRRELARVRALSAEDSLTGAKNRRYFDERVAAEVDRAARQNTPLSLLVVDLDDFKGVNDRHGHLAGDAALRWVAAFLAGVVREHDVVCRVGGDEFAIILPGADRRGAARLAGRLRTLVDRARVHGEAPVDMSIGYATWGREAPDAVSLLATADLAMYRNKLRNRAEPDDGPSSRWL